MNRRCLIKGKGIRKKHNIKGRIYLLCQINRITKIMYNLRTLINKWTQIKITHV